MRTVNVHEAKTHLSRLIAEAVESGEAFVIAKAGRPMVKVEPVVEVPIRFERMGFMRGEFAELLADFDKHDAEIEALFNGEPSETDEDAAA